jgi:Protein of unknown function (DUF3501)
MSRNIEMKPPRERFDITRNDVMAMSDYEKIRDARRKEIIEAKKNRRVAIGPYATFYFESYDTMWLQIHEMLYIEKGGEEQIADELAAFNPLIPKGRDLVSTLMFEIDDEALRKRILGALGGVEQAVSLEFGDVEIPAEAEQDVDRTTAGGKTSSVHFLHFRFSDAAAEAFKKTQGDVMLSISHPNYPHMTLLSGETKTALASDLA